VPYSPAAAVVSGLFTSWTISQQAELDREKSTSQFLRDERKAAYTDFMTRREEFYNSVDNFDSILKEVHGGRVAPDLDGLRDAVARISAAGNDFEIANASVRPLGSKGAANAAMTVQDEIDQLRGGMANTKYSLRTAPGWGEHRRGC
jgi:hypothetical protein